jgi:hypothetical protein
MKKEEQRQKECKTKEGNNCYHSKIYTKVDGQVCLFEISMGYYFHTMLLDASASKKRILKAENRH